MQSLCNCRSAVARPGRVAIAVAVAIVAAVVVIVAVFLRLTSECGHGNAGRHGEGAPLLGRLSEKKKRLSFFRVLEAYWRARMRQPKQSSSNIVYSIEASPPDSMTWPAQDFKCEHEDRLKGLSLPNNGRSLISVLHQLRAQSRRSLRHQRGQSRCNLGLQSARQLIS